MGVLRIQSHIHMRERQSLYQWSHLSNPKDSLCLNIGENQRQRKTLTVILESKSQCAIKDGWMSKYPSQVRHESQMHQGDGDSRSAIIYFINRRLNTGRRGEKEEEDEKGQEREMRRRKRKENEEEEEEMVGWGQEGRQGLTETGKNELQQPSQTMVSATDKHIHFFLQHILSLSSLSVLTASIYHAFILYQTLFKVLLGPGVSKGGESKVNLIVSS